jgi:hypothetical protein
MKHLKKLIVQLLALVIVGGVFWTLYGGSVSAVGTATLSFSPASGSYTNGSTLSVIIHENSGATGINTVESDLAYNPSQLQYVSSTMSGNFDFSPQNSGGNGLVCIVAGKLATALTNDQIVATVNFKVISSGSSVITFVNGKNNCSNGSTGSAIITQVGNQNIWNGVITAGSYTLKSPSPPDAAGGTANISSNPSSSSTTNSSGSTSSPTSSGSTSPSTPSGANTANTNTPTKLTTPTTNNSGYLVAIKIVDANNLLLKGVKVTLDANHSAVTDSTGIASFTNIKPGKYTVKAVVNGKTITKQIEVKNQAPLNVQQFIVKGSTKLSSVTKLILIGLVTVIVLFLVGFGLWRRLRSHFRPTDGYVPTDSTTAINEGLISESPTTNFIRSQNPSSTPTEIGEVPKPVSTPNQTTDQEIKNNVSNEEANHD